VNDVNPNISELKVEHDKEKDSKQLKSREKYEPGWTNRGLRTNIKKETSGDTGEAK
jgi:hypothetical protein